MRIAHIQTMSAFYFYYVERVRKGFCAYVQGSMVMLARLSHVKMSGVRNRKVTAIPIILEFLLETLPHSWVL